MPFDGEAAIDRGMDDGENVDDRLLNVLSQLLGRCDGNEFVCTVARKEDSMAGEIDRRNCQSSFEEIVCVSPGHAFRISVMTIDHESERCLSIEVGRREKS